MSKQSLADRLAQPRSLAAIFTVILGVVAISAIPAEARRHGGRHHSSHHHAGSHRLRHAGGGDAIIGEHRGYAAIVVDANSGRTLYARNENDLRHPASVTKVMTLYLLFEQLEKGRLRLDSRLMISSHAAMQAPSKLGLQPGETISVENAIKALVTKSANDIACAVAENIGGSEHNFARLMTQKAHALGMSRTHYENASGLPDPGQITTAHDLAVLGRAIQDRFPRYYRYFSTHSFAYNGALHRNHNHLLGQVEGMDGIKTGYTRASGFNLLTSVRRGNHHIVAVVMGGVTAGARDRAMANLIEEHIDGGSGVRTAAAITEDGANAQVADNSAGDRDEERVVERAPEPVVERHAERRVALEDTTASIPRQAELTQHSATQRQTLAAAPNVQPVQEKAPAVRPAFVSGVQKHAVVEPGEKKAKAKSHGKTETPAVADGSTTSRIAKTREVTAATTTPSAIRSSHSARADAARPNRPGWMIQIGATEDAEKANALLARARSHLSGFPSSAHAFTEKVQKGKETLYRARFAGLEEQSAESACKTLKRSGFSCFTTKN